jgi:excinuclease UvrABC ATPase subunit
LDVKNTDWVIDLGQRVGWGGKIIATGTPRDIAKSKIFLLSQYLAKIIWQGYKRIISTTWLLE